MADIQVTLTIPDTHTARAVEAFNGVAGARIRLEADKPETDFHGSWDFTIEPKGESETQLDFGKRVFKELGLAIVRMWDYAQDKERYNTEVQSLTPAQQDVPDELLT